MEDHEWELCKENVQPLRQGRHLSSLATALHSDQADSTENNLIREQQNTFELELRTYDGDDPFDVWDRYVKWTEQYFPKGGHDGQLAILIERCLKEFQGDQRYKNDSRIIRLWIKFACFSDDPVEVYKYMFDNEIGVQLASLYIEWAIATERKGDYKTADALYLLGLKQCIEGKDLLLQRQQQFQNRLARNITLQIAEQQHSATSVGDERSALARLRPTGPSHRVGATRTGSVLIGSAGRLQDSRPSIPQQLPNRGIPIFCDGESLPPTLPQQPTYEWQSIPVREIDNRENNKKPGVWTQAKVKQKVGAVASVLQPTPFQIHVDEEPAGMPQVTPRKTTLIVHSQPLSSRKAAQNDVLSAFRQQDETVSNVVIMYQKEKIYNGLSEFSFEELRAAKYWKRKKKQEAEQERRRQEEATRHRLEQELMEKNATISRMAALLSGLAINGSRENLALMQVMPELHHQHNNPSHEEHYTDRSNNSTRDDTSSSTSSFNRSNINGQHPVVSLDQGPTHPRTPLETYLENLDCHKSKSSSSKGSSQEDPVVPTSNPMPGASNSSSASPSGNERKGQSPANNEMQCSLTEKFITLSDDPSSTPLSELNKCSQPPLEKIAFTVPSPTVHTKEAMECINQFFCDSFAGETQATGFELTEAVNAEVQPAPLESISLSGTRRPYESTDNSPSAPQVKRKNRNGPINILKDMSPCLAQNDIQANTNKGLYIYCDENGSNQVNSNDQEVGLPRPKGLEIFCDSENLRDGRMVIPQSKMVASSHKGLQIHSDQLEDAENQREQVVPMSQGKLGTSSKKGLQIHCDRFQEAENQQDKVLPMPQGILGISSIKGLQIHDNKKLENLQKNNDVKQTTRRGLSFGSISGDVEMTEIDKYETKDLTIEWPAVESTLASLDHFNYLQAKAASTPCVPGNQSNQTQDAPDSESSCFPVITSYVEGLTTSKHLSPIFEGSGEGSSEEMKSGSQHSQTTSGVGYNVSKPQNNLDLRNEVLDAVDEEAKPIGAPGKDVLDSSCYHHIEAVTDPQNLQDDILSTSLDLDLRDPFDQQVNCKFLETIKPPLCDYPNYMACDCDLDDIIPGNTIAIGDITLYVNKCIGEGGYAKIFEVSAPSFNQDETMTGLISTASQVLKFQRPACYWEFYIICELHRRLDQHKSSMNIIPAIMHIDRGCFYRNASVLQMKLIPWGSLLNLVNFCRKDRMRQSQVEPFACLLTIELLHMFEQIHKCQIIHGDVKPDNFLLLDVPNVKNSKDPKEVFGNKLSIVQLIDFGQSIDMTKFSDGTTFRASVKTSGFQCIEMRTQRPWTFQTDLFGLAGTIHVVLFGSYMNVYQENGLWKITGNYVRKWNVQLWKNFFHELLNIPSCHHQPDLAALRKPFEDYFIESCIPHYNKWAQSIRSAEDLWTGSNERNI